MLYEIGKSRVPFGETEQKISDLFQNDSHLIANAGITDSLCVVTGPWGIGKSSFLIPRIAQSVISRGVDALVIDCQNYVLSEERGFSTFLSKIPQVERGVLILDEAGLIYLTRKNDGIYDVLKYAHHYGWNVIPIIAYNPRNPEINREEPPIWFAEELKLGGSVNNVRLPNYRLPRNLSKEFVQYVSETQYRRKCNEETLTYLLEIVPGHLRMLDMLSLYSNYPLTEFIKELYQFIPNLERSLTPKEMRIFMEKLNRDYQRIILKR